MHSKNRLGTMHVGLLLTLQTTLIIIIILQCVNFAFPKQYLIRRPPQKRSDPSESFLFGEPIITLNVAEHIDTANVVAGDECGAVWRNNSAYGAVMLVGKHCMLFGRPRCYFPTTTSTTVKTTPAEPTTTKSSAVETTTRKKVNMLPLPFVFVSDVF